MSRLHLYQEHDLLPLVNQREGETKIGQAIGLVKDTDLNQALTASTARFVLLGIPEDIGVRANNGIGGAHTAWHGFLKSFLNIQQTDNFRGEDFLLLGEMDFTDLMVNCTDAGIEKLRQCTAHIDEEVYPVIQVIATSGKIPVVIGGGHNNAYPILKGTSMAWSKMINVVNLDAHSDFRIAEGRHSGNGFRYAYQDGFLKKYAMLGLHEAYNSQPILAELDQNLDLLPLFWEDIFLREKTDWYNAVQIALEFVQHETFGVELDVDCIEHVLSSAATPVGITARHAMQYLYQCGLKEHAAYLHLPEGVVERADGQRDVFTGKLISYLVQAFAKGVLERKIE